MSRMHGVSNTLPELEDAEFQRLENDARTVSLTDFVKRDVKKPQWAVEGIWARGAAGVIGAQPKNGKSTIALELAVSFATGTRFCQHFEVKQPPAKVLYVQRENSDVRVLADLHHILEARELGTTYTQEFGSSEMIALTDGTEVEDTVEIETFVPAWELQERTPPVLDVISNPQIDLSMPAWRAWLWRKVETNGYSYVILDPWYQMVSEDENSPLIKVIFTYFTALKNRLGCAPIITHHESDKKEGQHARRLLGHTYLHGWYENAIYPTRHADGSFTLEVDALREMGATPKYLLQGMGVGRWAFEPDVQFQHDGLGRGSPQQTKRQINMAKARAYLATNPDCSNPELGRAIGVSKNTARDYRAEIAAEVDLSDLRPDFGHAR